MAVSLVRVWEGRGGLLAFSGPGTERIRIETGRTARTSLTLRRSGLDAAAPPAPPLDEHLAVGPGEAPPAWLPCADVIIRDAPSFALTALRSDYPGCLVAAVASRSGGWELAVAGWRFALVPLGRAAAAAAAAADVASYASAVHAWVASGRPVGALGTATLTLARGRGGTDQGGGSDRASCSLTASSWGDFRTA
ncbi:hypothetical protein [Actinomadura litoris]|uniref:hypothetical protein n=1 Tax=Actinomadura litoris TaxID=2678616 RepID=UPI001FA73970|nr:hypothetical protein [Actinomadura litoris]